MNGDVVEEWYNIQVKPHIFNTSICEDILSSIGIRKISINVLTYHVFSINERIIYSYHLNIIPTHSYT